MHEETKDALILNGEQVSADSLKARSEPPAMKTKSYAPWLRLAARFPVWTFALIFGVPFAIVSSAWKPLEKHFPKLNELIHSDVSSQEDVDYQTFKWQESQAAYAKQMAVCNKPGGTFEECRTAIIGAEPSLIDLDMRITRLSGVWQKELAEKMGMPEVCRQAGSRT